MGQRVAYGEALQAQERGIVEGPVGGHYDGIACGEWAPHRLGAWPFVPLCQLFEGAQQLSRLRIDIRVGVAGAHVVAHVGPCACAVARRGLYLVGVVYLVAHGVGEVDVEVEVVERAVESETAGEVGIGVADDGDVLGVYHAVAVEVLQLHCAGAYADAPAEQCRGGHAFLQLIGVGGGVIALEVACGIVAVRLPAVDESDGVAHAHNIVLLVLVVGAGPS